MNETNQTVCRVCGASLSHTFVELGDVATVRGTSAPGKPHPILSRSRLIDYLEGAMFFGTLDCRFRSCQCEPVICFARADR